MKKIICLVLCAVVFVSCFVLPQYDVEAYPTNYGKYSVDYVNDLNTKYGILTDSEIKSLNQDDEITLDMVLTMMARVHYKEKHPNVSISNMPKNTVKYCLDNGILEEGIESYDVPLTRGAFAYLLINAIQEKDMLEINNISDGSIPDVEDDYFYKDEVYACYRYGLICGVDAKGTFKTENTLTVNQAFTVLNRVMNPNLRQAVSFYTEDTVKVESVEYPMSYKNLSKGLEINITKERYFDSDCYVANIKMTNPAHMKTIYSDLSWTNIGCEISTFNQRINSIFMVNGDFRNSEYGADLGIVRNNEIVNNKKFNNVLGFTKSGDLVAVKEGNAQAVLDKGIRETWTFGPWLVKDGKMVNGLGNETKHPRTFIGQVKRADNVKEYIIVVADGRSLTNAGLTNYEMASIMVEKNCDIAYNLDGGGSSAMMFMGKVLNDPCYGERADIDYIYIK